MGFLGLAWCRRVQILSLQPLEASKYRNPGSGGSGKTKARRTPEAPRNESLNPNPEASCCLRALQGSTVLKRKANSEPIWSPIHRRTVQLQSKPKIHQVSGIHTGLRIGEGIAGFELYQVSGRLPLEDRVLHLLSLSCEASYIRTRTLSRLRGSGRALLQHSELLRLLDAFVTDFERPTAGKLPSWEFQKR